MCAVSIAQRGQRDAHIFIEHGRGRGVARGYIRASARCYLAAQSGLGKFQHGQQLEPGGGADQYRVLRRVEYNLNIIRSLHNDVDRNAAVQRWCACLYFRTSSPLSTSISITGAGIVNNSSNAPTFIVGNQANIFFRGTSSAGNATIITNAGGLTAFVDSATGGNARFITLAGGAFDITSLSSGGMAAGSIEGAGTFSLGPNLLTVGSNNLSTTVSGLIRGTGGSLVQGR